MCFFCPIVTKVGVPLQSSVKVSNSDFRENFSSIHTEGQAKYQVDFHYVPRASESPKAYKATMTFPLPFYRRVVCTANTGEFVQRTAVC